jgi:hypothetical protein
LLRDICYAIFALQYLPSAIATLCRCVFAFKNVFFKRSMRRLFNFQFCNLKDHL